MLKHLHLAMAALAALAALTSCSGNDDSPPAASPVESDPSPLSNAGSYANIYFDGSLTAKERGAFVTAMAYLDQTPLTNADSELLNMMRISGSTTSVHGWLEDRVQYIVNDNTDGTKLNKTDLRGFTYPNPGVFGSPDGKFGVNEDGPQTIMLNIGAALYTAGKQQNFLWQINADGLGERLLTSARTGILMVGDGLFMAPAKYPHFVKIFHLGTLLHEARHSDGNGKTTGFFHAICTSEDPDMAPYKGQAACDHGTNGPYTIGALATQALMNSCTSCSEAERNALYGLYLDYKSRVIRDGQTQAWDDAPEGHR